MNHFLSTSNEYLSDYDISNIEFNYLFHESPNYVLSNYLANNESPLLENHRTYDILPSSSNYLPRVTWVNTIYSNDETSVDESILSDVYYI